MPVPCNPWVAVQAEHFDRWITEHSEAYEGGAYWDWTRDQFVRYTLRYLPRDAIVFDVGCGDGYYAAQLAERSTVRRVVAIDVAPAVIAYARVRHPSPKITFECATFEEWDSPQRFDAVYCCETIEHLDDVAAALERIAQLLHPGGVLCVSTPNRLRLENIARRCIGFAPVLIDPMHAREFSGAELGRLADACGFQVVSRRTHTAWAEWAFAPLFLLRRVHAIDAFLKNDFARGRCRWNYHLGRLLGPFGGTLQCIMRKT